MTKPDRRAYWREYQRKRYAARNTFKNLPEIRQGAKASADEFRQQCVDLNLTGQRNWRKRRELKIALGLRSALTTEADIKAFLLSRAAAGAKARNIPFTVTPADIKLPLVCPLLKLKLDYSDIGKGRLPNAPSLDRIDNTLGYVPGNIQVISHRANILKRDATLAEMQALGAWAKKYASTPRPPAAILPT